MVDICTSTAAEARWPGLFLRGGIPAAHAFTSRLGHLGPACVLRLPHRRTRHRGAGACLLYTSLVLDHGRVVEEGTHAELIAKGGVYNQLHEEQLLEEAEG